VEISQLRPLHGHAGRVAQAQDLIRRVEGWPLIVVIDEIYQDWKWGSFKKVSPSARSAAFFDTASRIFFEIEKTQATT